jgi:protein-tyrosine-phosphatase
MAEAALKHLVLQSGEQLDVFSRGLITPGRTTVHEWAVKACLKSGVQIDQNRQAVRLSLSNVHSSDLILVMEQAHRSALRRDFPAYTGKVHMLGRWQGVEIDDPLGGDEEQFARCLCTIRRGVAAWMEHFREYQRARTASSWGAAMSRRTT